MSDGGDAKGGAGVLCDNWFWLGIIIGIITGAGFGIFTYNVTMDYYWQAGAPFGFIIYIVNSGLLAPLCIGSGIFGGFIVFLFVLNFPTVIFPSIEIIKLENFDIFALGFLVTTVMRIEFNCTLKGALV